MSAPAKLDIDALRATVTRQAGRVRELKAAGSSQEEITAAVAELQALRKSLDEAAADEATGATAWTVNKQALDDCVTRRMFYVPAFEIHGGVGGLFDYGPAGCAVKENMLSLWRQHFILEDSMLQIECTTLTPYAVLKASGHVDKFEDLMVKDPKTGECFRADKLLEDFIANVLKKDKELTSARRDELRLIAAQAGSYKKERLHELFGELKILSPTTGNVLTEPFQFNLMFETKIGPAGNQVGFLRPETAQGMFVNFRRLYDYANGRMPMAVAQIGTAYRNEIAPRGALLRVREFTMAEIEHFVHPERKAHAKFASVAGLRLNLFAGANQVGDGKIQTPTLGEAVASGLVNNETLAYYMGRTFLYLTRVGIKPEGLRFRQHLRTEMAHYACDCWDAEILMSSGWVECVGIADRSAFDLQVHAKATGVDLIAREALPEPVFEEYVFVSLNKGLMGKSFKAENGAVVAELEALGARGKEEALAFQARLAADGQAPLSVPALGKEVVITKAMATLTLETRKVSERKYTPNVIEPSFGIGRILTGILEHSFSVRGGDDEMRAVLSFRPAVAPFKAVVLPLDNVVGRDPRNPTLALQASLTAAGLSATVDDSGASIGKRYSRSDEIGVPFGVTVDRQSLEDGTVTLRERDTCAQVRLPSASLVPLLRALVDESLSWDEVMRTHTVVTTGEEKAAAAGGAAAAASAAAAPAAAPAAAAAPVAAAAPAAAAAAAVAPAAAAPAAIPGATAYGVNTTGGTVGVKLEGEGRASGRFYRPAV